MTFLTTLFMWTGFISWLCFAVLLLAALAEWWGWRRIERYSETDAAEEALRREHARWN